MLLQSSSALRVILFAAIVLVVGCSQPSTKVDVPVAQMLRGRTMGTTYVVKFMTTVDGPSSEEVERAVSEVLDSVNAQMSTYIASSEISQFNASKSADWFAVSRETAEVAKLAKEIHKKTAGAFDITVAPLVDLWGFGPSRNQAGPPSESRIDELLEYCSSDHLEVRLSPPALRKQFPQLRIDMSAIAKGHGVDRIAEKLDKLGVASYFVEVGGEIRAAGSKGQGTPWRAGIERPLEEGRDLMTAVDLDDDALASSGNYRNFYMHEDGKYWHTIDPRTGWPAPADLLQASVLANTCAEADAIATAMMVLGKDALRVAEENNWSVMLVLPDENESSADTESHESGLRIQTTPNFASRLPKG